MTSENPNDDVPDMLEVNGSHNNDGNDNEEEVVDQASEEDKQRTANAIIEMLKQSGVSTTKILEEKRHAFWDTQVRDSLVGGGTKDTMQGFFEVT